MLGAGCHSADVSADDLCQMTATISERPTSNHKIKGPSAAHCAFGPHRTAVAANNAPDGRESDAGPLELRVGVKPLKHPKQLSRVSHVETCSVVTDEECGAAAFDHRSKFDLSGGRL